jgi:hypothetical protein
MPWGAEMRLKEKLLDGLRKSSFLKTLCREILKPDLKQEVEGVLTAYQSQHPLYQANGDGELEGMFTVIDNVREARANGEAFGKVAIYRMKVREIQLAEFRTFVNKYFSTKE